VVAARTVTIAEAAGPTYVVIAGAVLYETGTVSVYVGALISYSYQTSAARMT
jgi:hypothetical protein